VVQEKKLLLQEKVDKLKDKSKRMFETIDERRSDMIQKWEDKSREFIDAFLLLFGREGRLVQIDISMLNCVFLIVCLASHVQREQRSADARPLATLESR
jgi:hypothetical protein